MQAIRFPISVLPVKDIIFASGWRTKASPAVAPVVNSRILLLISIFNYREKIFILFELDFNKLFKTYHNHKQGSKHPLEDQYHEILGIASMLYKM